MIGGFWGFLKTAFMIVLVFEASAFLDEFFGVCFELRKGFTGTRAMLTKTFSRHALKILRLEGNLSQHLVASGKYFLVFLAAGLLPGWSGQIPISMGHSLWVFLGLMILGPCAHLVLEWVIKKGAGWPVVLTTAERAIGSATVLFILSITLVAITGADSFEDFRKIQQDSGWLILRFPLALPLLFAFAAMNLFSSFQTIFSRTGDKKQDGWSFNEFLPYLRRVVWSLFMVDVFMGGAVYSGIAGDLFLLVKAVLLNVLSSAASQFFFQLREDQAEAFVLWRLAPISILILALSLLLPGRVL